MESRSYSAIVNEGFGPKVIYCSSNSSSEKAVLRKKCYENMQQIYRRTPTLKCDFNKVALRLWRYASVTSLTTIDMCQGWAFVEMELLVKIESGFQPMTIFTKSSILEVWKGSEYASKCNRWILIYYSAVSLPVFESDISRNSQQYPQT